MISINVPKVVAKKYVRLEWTVDILVRATVIHILLVKWMLLVTIMLNA